MRTRLLSKLAPLAVVVGAASSLYCASTSAGRACAPGDADGVQGGDAVLQLRVDDQAFSPTILKAQNRASVTLRLTNIGTAPHDFAVDCLPTPNDQGCPSTSCFPDASAVGSLGPDATATVTFVTPNPEGIYTFRSNLPGDTQVGQFVVQ
jgi:hypothetical protein